MAKIKYFNFVSRQSGTKRQVDSIVGEDYKRCYKERMSQIVEINRRNHKTRIKAQEVFVTNMVSEEEQET